MKAWPQRVFSDESIAWGGKNYAVKAVKIGGVWKCAERGFGPELAYAMPLTNVKIRGKRQ